MNLAREIAIGGGLDESDAPNSDAIVIDMSSPSFCRRWNDEENHKPSPQLRGKLSENHFHPIWFPSAPDL